MNIWDSCEGARYAKRINVTPWRIVETQEKSYSRKLVSSDAELNVLENMLEKNKPKIDEKLYKSHHYLLFTPFRYPPLKYGSRFGRQTEPSIWYGSLDIETALREVAYYRLLFLKDSEETVKLNFMLSAFSVKAAVKKGIDLTKPPFEKYEKQISSKKTYQHSQALGTSMRKNDIELFLYRSARSLMPTTNVGIFYPSVFKDGKLHDEPLSWNCYAEKESVEFWRTNKEGTLQKIICSANDFKIDASLRYPKTLDTIKSNKQT